MGQSVLRTHAQQIWNAGVHAVKSDVLVRQSLTIDKGIIRVQDTELNLDEISRIAIVGCGKAGAQMGKAAVQQLGDHLQSKDVHGWINVPEDCAHEKVDRITLHAARPVQQNIPTKEGVRGSEEILKIVQALNKNDLAIVLISGGGSALMPCPVEGISLDEKMEVTKFLTDGASINELNTVRKRLSKVKGGGLARACQAERLFCLIISDVINDPLDVIASGPTANDTSTFRDALNVLEKFGATSSSMVSDNVIDYIRAKAEVNERVPPVPGNVTNYVIGNNSVAVAAAKKEAESLGYHVLNLSSYMNGHASDVGRILASVAWGIRDRGEPCSPPACIISGGEPVVRLASAKERGVGGRNQEVVLGALERLWENGLDRMAVLSGGTDGEDGPSNAAGAVADEKLYELAKSRNLQPGRYLETNDAYNYLESLGGLIPYSPTHTNVMDLRILLVS